MAESYTFDDNLGYLLNRCAAQMAQRFQRELDPYGISLAQWGALLAIHQLGQALPSDVAARVGIDRGATTRLIARMEEKGLVERQANARDGRSVVLSLSSATRSLMPELIALSKRVNQEALGALPAKDRAALMSTLDRLLQTLSH